MNCRAGSEEIFSTLFSAICFHAFNYLIQFNNLSRVLLKSLVPMVRLIAEQFAKSASREACRGQTDPSLSGFFYPVSPLLTENEAIPIHSFFPTLGSSSPEEHFPIAKGF